MKSIVYCLLFCFTLALSTEAQPGSSNAATVKEQAQKMEAAFVAKDFKAFAHYSNPAIKKLMGGEEAYIKGLEQMIGQMKDQGMAITKVTIGDPSAILKSGTELQCTVPQAMEVKMQCGRAIAKSTLIAVSTDGGVITGPLSIQPARIFPRLGSCYPI